MKMKIGAGYVMAVALTGFGAAAASAQESGTVTYARTAAPTEACTIVHATAAGEMAFTTHERVAVNAIHAQGEAGEVKVYRTTRADDGSYITSVVSPALEATTVQGQKVRAFAAVRDGEKVDLREVPIEQVKELHALTAAGHAVDAVKVEGHTLEATKQVEAPKYHVKRPAPQAMSGTIERVPLTEVRAFSVEGHEVKPAECKVLVRTIKDQQ